jgi:cytochrome c553
VRALPIPALVLLSVALPAQDASNDFTQSIRPVLQANCAACHNPANPKNRVDFLKAQNATDIESARGQWRSVAAQLRNRTMPPVASKLTEDERLRIATWV